MKRDLQKLTDRLFKEQLAMAMMSTDLDALDDEFEMYKKGTVKTDTLLSDINQTFAQIHKRLENLN